jgi:hypothetical protein
LQNWQFSICQAITQDESMDKNIVHNIPFPDAVMQHAKNYPKKEKQISFGLIN